MAGINSETWNKAEVSVICVHKNDDVNNCHLSKRWGGKNIYDLIDKEIKGKYNVKNMNKLKKPQIRKYKIDRATLFKGSKHSMYVHEVIAITILMQTRLFNLKTMKFRAELGFNQII